MTKINSHQNVILTEALNKLWQTAVQLEQSTNIPQELDAVEGRRFLMRMLSASVDSFVEYIDANRPEFRHSETAHRKMFGDCPDADYLQAPIDLRNGRSYRVKGQIPKETVYVGVMLYGRGGRMGVRLTDEELNADNEGNFELLISADPKQNPDLLGEGDEPLVMVRQYFTDRETEPPLVLQIELLGEDPAPRSLDSSWLAKRIELSRRMLESIFHRTLDAYGRIANFPANTFADVPVDLLFPTPDNSYKICWYELNDDQVIVVRGTLPKARYFSFTFYNVWLESYDYTRHSVILNHKQIELDEDGCFEIYVADKNAGYSNWLDTAGHNSGYLVARSLLLEGDHPEFEVQVI
ncbi:MAG TPA: DUF1214 domain-containing protein [Candidatus Marinimicrobia bacterium]|jgi:hypothetical protein|nr:DUF1214 domain-containing protein [Candidatus Neomarinimicrobiota bacterium]HIN46138.1 DUF1214 domain-containing protein [Candidatus Neomarinimicrobiota bacterium]